MSGAWIHGAGVITPAVAGGIPDLPGVLRETPASPPRSVERIPLPSGMKPQDGRRMARLTLLALWAADRCWADLRGRDAGLYVGLTHGTTALLKEFHDFLYDYGPDKASPNAFSNGVTNAPLGAVSKHLTLTKGGHTLVGFENVGLDVLDAACAALERGSVDLCCAGAAEEFSPLAEEAYSRCGWSAGPLPGSLPLPQSPGAWIGLSEASAFFALSREPGGCRYESLGSIDDAPGDTDLVISGASGGPQDLHELAALQSLSGRFAAPPALLFPKLWFGETFAVSAMLAVALACGICTGEAPAFVSPLDPSLRSCFLPSPPVDRPLRTALIVAAGRTGEVSAGLVTCRGC